MDTRKKVTAIAAIITAIAMILTGTFAWNDFTQHSTNVFAAKSITEVRLVDDFARPPTNWLEEETIEKNVSVINMGKGKVYVRLQFKEFLETYTLEYEKFTNATGGEALFATHSRDPYKGQFVTATTAEVSVANMITLGYIPRDITFGPNYPDPDLRNQTITYFITTPESKKDGIYGRAMNNLANPILPAQKVKTFGGTDKADYSIISEHYYHNQSNGLASASNAECYYEVHKWSEHSDDCGIHEKATDTDAIHDYVSWKLADNVQYMSSWDGQLGEFWLLDEDGWAYWAQPLESGPAGYTDNIMESVTLIQMPGQAFEYNIHIDMEAITYDELNLFETDTMTRDTITSNTVLIAAFRDRNPTP